MKTSIKLQLPVKSLTLALTVGLLTSGVASAVPDCTNTAWKASNGQTCAKLGLNSNKAICEANHKFATLCDDTSTQIRTCVSDIPCNNKKGNTKSYDNNGVPGEG